MKRLLILTLGTSVLHISCSTTDPGSWATVSVSRPPACAPQEKKCAAVEAKGAIGRNRCCVIRAATRQDCVPGLRAGRQDEIDRLMVGVQEEQEAIGRGHPNSVGDLSPLQGDGQGTGGRVSPVVRRHRLAVGTVEEHLSGPIFGTSKVLSRAQGGAGVSNGKRGFGKGEQLAHRPSVVGKPPVSEP